MTATLAMILKSLSLAMRLHAAVPSLPLDQVVAHTMAAEHAATPQVTPELLLAVAFVESRFDPTATSRVEHGTRLTGAYRSTQPPADLTRSAGLFCGPLQTIARSWQQCLAMRSLPVAYHAGVSELETWLRDRRVHGNIRRALAGHGCGNYGVVSGRCNDYPSRVLGMERRFSEPPRRARETPST